MNKDFFEQVNQIISEDSILSTMKGYFIDEFTYPKLIGLIVFACTWFVPYFIFGGSAFFLFWTLLGWLLSIMAGCIAYWVANKVLKIVLNKKSLMGTLQISSLIFFWIGTLIRMAVDGLHWIPLLLYFFLGWIPAYLISKFLITPLLQRVFHTQEDQLI